MENSEKFLIAAVMVFAAIAIVLALAFPAKPAQQLQPPAAQLSASEALFFRMKSFGENFSGYSYSYNESSNGYPIIYRLYSSGGISVVEAEDPLALKKVYFLQNDTVMCLRFMGNESCSSVGGEAGLKNYMASLRSRFFDNSRIASGTATMRDGMGKGYISVGKGTAPASYGGRPCTEGTYVFDFTNISYQDMPRFGLAPGTPLRFDGSYCVDESGGALVRSQFNYTMNGGTREWKSVLISLDTGYSSAISAPAAGNTSVVGELMSEQGYYEKMANCYMKAGEDKDKCVALVALDLRSTALCDHAGTRRDRCIVSMMPLLLDESLCQTIASLDYRDDCYIEMAGGRKLASYCGMVQNATKKEFCMNVSGTLPLAPGANSTGGNSTNSTGQ